MSASRAPSVTSCPRPGETQWAKTRPRNLLSSSQQRANRPKEDASIWCWFGSDGALCPRPAAPAGCGLLPWSHESRFRELTGGVVQMPRLTGSLGEFAENVLFLFPPSCPSPLPYCLSLPDVPLHPPPHHPLYWISSGLSLSPTYMATCNRQCSAVLLTHTPVLCAPAGPPALRLCNVSCVSCGCPLSVWRESLCQWVWSPPVPRSFSQTSPATAPQKTCCFLWRPWGDPSEAAVPSQATPRPASQTHCQDCQPLNRWVKTSSGGVQPCLPFKGWSLALFLFIWGPLHLSGEVALWDIWVFPCASWYTQSWPGFVCFCQEAFNMHLPAICQEPLSCVSVNMYIGIYVADSRLFAHRAELDSMSKSLQRWRVVPCSLHNEFAKALKVFVFKLLIWSLAYFLY